MSKMRIILSLPLLIANFAFFGSSSITLGLNDSYQEQGATANDEVDGNITSVSDSSANSASISRTILVEDNPDTTPPTISVGSVGWQKISSGDVSRADLIKNTDGVFHTNNYYSPDGISWQTTTFPPHNNWINASGYGNGTFVLTGATGQLWTSTDFDNWTSRNPGGEDITDVVFGGGVFVARKYWSSSEVWLSADLGSTWQSANTGSVPDRSGYNFLAYGNGSFIRPANNGVHTSTDGISWNTVNPSNIPADFSFIYRMYYSENAGFFLSNVGGRDGSEVSITTAVSSSGEEWQFYKATITTNITGDFQSTGFAGNLIFLTGYDNTTDLTEVWVSDNLGADWSKIESGPWTSTENDWATFASNGSVLAVGTGSEIYTTSLSSSLDTDGDYTMYGINHDTDSLVTINLVTGVVSNIGSLGIDVGPHTGLDYDPSSGKLITALSPPGGYSNLYEINLNTGTATNIKSIEFSEQVMEDDGVNWLGFSSNGTLYAWNERYAFNTGDFWLVDTDIGTSTKIADSSLPSVLGADYQEGVGYWISDEWNGTIYRIDEFTGSIEFTGTSNIWFTGNGPGDLFDLDYAPDGVLRVAASDSSHSGSTLLVVNQENGLEESRLNLSEEILSIASVPTESVALDTDGDGLSDFVETNTGVYVSETDTGTDPNNADTDADGLSDAAEIDTHLTNPNLIDTDSDGLSDGLEINTYSSDPLEFDTSGDGLSDGFIVTAGFDPVTDYSGLLTTSALNALGYFSGSQIVDARLGSIGITINENSVILKLQIERSEDLQTWTAQIEDQILVPIELSGDHKFFRFSLSQE